MWKEEKSCLWCYPVLDFFTGFAIYCFIVHRRAICCIAYRGSVQRNDPGFIGSNSRIRCQVEIPASYPAFSMEIFWRISFLPIPKWSWQRPIIWKHMRLTVFLRRYSSVTSVSTTVSAWQDSLWSRESSALSVSVYRYPILWVFSRTRPCSTLVSPYRCHPSCSWCYVIWQAWCMWIRNIWNVKENFVPLIFLN